MNNVIEVDFQSKPTTAEENGAILRDELLRIFAETGFYRPTATAMADQIVARVTELLADFQNVEIKTNIAVPGDMSIADTVRSALEQQAEQFRPYIRSVLDKAILGIVTAAQSSCIVMAHADQLPHK